MKPSPFRLLPRSFTKGLLLGAAALAVTLAPAAASTVLFYDDFSSYSGAQTSSTMGSWALSGNKASTEHSIEVLTDTGNLFGQGTDNHYLRFFTQDTSAMTMRVVDQFNAGSLMTLSFSIVVPQKSGYTRDIDIRAGTDIIGGTNIANRSTLKANSINSGSFSFDTSHRVDIVFNSTNATVSNYYESYNLLPLSFDVWVDGTLLAAGQKVTGAYALADMTSISFQSLSGSTLPAEFYLDWVGVSQGAAIMAPIPEPSTAFLLFPTATLACLWSLRAKLR